MDNATLADLAREFQVCTRTVRRMAARLGVDGVLRRRGSGSVRVFGTEEVERMRAYFREHAPEPEEEAAVEEDDEKVEEGQAKHAEGDLAVPPSGHVAEFLDLLADLRDVIARASAGEGRATAAVEEVATLREEVHQLREVLSAVAARLPGPPAPPSPPPRIRPRVVAEVVLLGWVGLLAGVLGAVVLQRLADVGVVTLPAWWPIG